MRPGTAAQRSGPLAAAAAIALVSALGWSAACTRADVERPAVLVGAGATLPHPLYGRWATEYAKVDPSVRVDYQSVGSGAGVRQVLDGVVDFGATDEPMSETESESARTPVVHVPTTIGAIAITYNIPGAPPLRLTADLVADVFLGNVTRWDDARVRAANPDRALPAEAITVVHRADGSGTSATFTAYLSRTSDAWRERVGAGTTPRFLVGVGAKGNEGVAAFVKRTPGTIGYVELAHAKRAGLPVALVRNRAGAFVAPTLGTIERAARAGGARRASAPRPSLLDTDDEGGYPITALSCVVVPRDARDPARGAALAKFLWWAVHDGQRMAPALELAELPPDLVRYGERALRELRAGGRPLLAPEG